MQRVRLQSLAALAALGIASLSAQAVGLPAGVTAVPLAKVTNDRDASVSRLQLLVDAHAGVEGIYLATSANADSDPAAARGQMYPLASIESAQGVVLGQGQGVKAIFLRGNIRAQAGQGALVIRYLKNGVFRHWGECRINMQKLGPHDWRLVNAYDGQPIDSIQVKTWALGISTLANVCPAGEA